MKTRRIYGLSGTFFLASCFLLLAGGCEEADRIDTKIPPREVVLNFDASVTRTVNPETRDVTTMDEFSDNDYQLGISITKDNEAKGTIFTGSNDLTAGMRRAAADAPWEWSFKRTSDNVEVDKPLKAPAGKPLKVLAYYSATGTTAGAFTNGIPFDFTATSSLMQTEILYNTETTTTLTASPDGSAVNIPLKFQHAYSWIVVNVSKYLGTGDPVNLSSVAIDNLSGNWIKNKGTISPETGLAMAESTIGPIKEIKGDQPLSVTSDNKPVTYNFLVPSFMDANVKDGDVVLVLSVNGNQEYFPLLREHLNQDGNTYGFRQGYMNTYNLEFNNSSLALNLVNWTSTTINGSFGEEPSTSWDYVLLDYDNTYPSRPVPSAFWPSITGQTIVFPAKPTFLSSTDIQHPFDNYLTTVAYGGNGAYIPKGAEIVVPTGGIQLGDYQGLAGAEKINSKIYITTKDISIESVSWQNENGVLAAKEICQKYNGGGLTGWRLPRVSELRALFIYYTANSAETKFEKLGFNADANQYVNYWTGTEESADRAWCMYYYSTVGNFLFKGPVISVANKSERYAVRCVRDYYPTDPK